MEKKLTDEQIKQIHIRDAEKAKESLDKNNTDHPQSLWESVKKYRKSCLDEIIIYHNTGKTDHINIDSKMPSADETKDIQHFK